jgi:hypothetical protein
MAEEIRPIITDAIKRIVESTWRGREHSVEEIVEDIKNFLDEEEEYIVTENEWQEILDQYPISDLSGKIFQIKDTFVGKHGYGKGEGKKEGIEPGIGDEGREGIRLTSDDPIIQEQELVEKLREVRKQGVKKIVSLYQERFSHEKGSPTDNQLINFLKENTLERKENRRTVIIALQRIVGLEKIRRVFDIMEDKRPFDSKMELFELWLKRQKNT